MNLPAQKRISRVCTENQLYSITYNQISLVGSQELSPRARRYLSFFITVVKLGYHSIIANADTIADAIYRAQGQTKSVRTLQYALKEIETAGFCSRKKFRVGKNHFKTIIEFNIERFVYWTKIKSKKLTPITTSSHISPYAQDLQIDDRRNNSPCLTPQNTYLNEHNKQCAYTRSKHYANFKHLPIIFTLLTILKGKPDRGKILALAQREIDGYSSATDIRWKHWGSIWHTMPIEEREGIARVDFLPRLRQSLTTAISPHTEPRCQKRQSTQPKIDNGAQPFDPLPIIRAMIEKTNPKEETTNVEESTNNKENEECILSEEELLILTGAKNAFKNRL